MQESDNAKSRLAWRFRIAPKVYVKRDAIRSFLQLTGSRYKRSARLLAPLALMLLPGCSQFSLDASLDKPVICPVDHTRVQWSSKGYYEVRLTGGGQNQQLKNDTQPEASDFVTLSPQVTTTYYLEGTVQGRQGQHSFTIEVATPSGRFDLPLLWAGCQGRQAFYKSTVTSGSGGFPTFTSLDLITRVDNLNDRKILVDKGYSVLVDAGASTNGFTGSPVGTWSATMPLSALETCPPPTGGSGELPPELRLGIHYGCK